MSIYYLNYGLGCELAHHGIKGQKWGVRRTPEQLGRGRYAKRITRNLESISGKKSKQEYLRSEASLARQKFKKSKADAGATVVGGFIAALATKNAGPIFASAYSAGASFAVNELIASRREQTLNDINDAYGLNVSRGDLRIRNR